jgi:glycosyltransferase involved in cell wall biosynthesis
MNQNKSDNLTKNSDDPRPGKSPSPSLVIASAYFAPQIGGLERYTLEMTKAAVRRGYEVSVITSGEARSTTVDTIEGATIYRLPTQFKISNTPVNLNWYRELRQLLHEIQPDLVNVHSPVPFMADVAAFAARGIPVVVTYHAGSMKKRSLVSDWVVNLYELLILPRMLNKASLIICSSDFVRETFLKKFQHKSITITPGVDIETFTRREGERTSNRVLFVGNFTNGWKGLNYLRDAVAMLPQVKLNVVGKGIHVEWPRTEYHGELSGEKLVDMIHNSSLLALPSVAEPEAFGMVLVEAMACGIPVIGSRIGGIPKLISDQVDGLLVAPANAKELAAAIDKLVSNPKLADQYANKAYEKVRKQYTWQLKTDQYIDSLDEIIGRPAR